MGALSAYFLNRPLLIASQHGKEQVMAPLLENRLGVRSFVPEGFDTDQFGTFTGELERTAGPLETLRSKCLKAMQQYDCDLAVASEGSFGPHPALFLVPANDELVMMIDQRHGLEVIVRELSTATNFSGARVSSTAELLDFAQKAGFPSHGLILSDRKDSPEVLIKGIRDSEILLSAFQQVLEKYGKVYVETDMRAMHNPSRMQVIERATLKLIEQLHSSCPACGTPGFGVVEVRSGLPCADCGLPTRSTLSHIYTCKKCSHTEEKKYPNNKYFEEPTYCDLCNP